MSFFQKIAQYVINNLLVETLAKSPSFQRFAIKTDQFMKEGSKSVEPHLKDAAESVNAFHKAFRDNLSKEMKAMMEKNNTPHKQ